MRATSLREPLRRRRVHETRERLSVARRVGWTTQSATGAAIPAAAPSLVPPAAVHRLAVGDSTRSDSPAGVRNATHGRTSSWPLPYRPLDCSFHPSPPSWTGLKIDDLRLCEHEHRRRDVRVV